MGADFIVMAERVHTMTSPVSPPDSADRAQAVAWAGGRITAIGTREDIQALASTATRIVDLPGATVVPGLVDSHIHPVFGIELARGANLSECRTLDAVRGALRSEVENLAPGEWLLGWALDPNVFGPEGVTNVFLNDIAQDRPAFVRLFDAHSAVVSNEVIRRAGLTGGEDFADNSRVVVGPNGLPTGYLLEMGAMQPVLDMIPTLSFEEQASSLLRILSDMASTGFTHGQVQDFADGSAELLTYLESQGDLPLSLRLSPWCYPGAGHDRVEELIAMQGQGGRRWRVEGVKLMIDGTIDNGTAWLYTPDTFGESTSSLWLKPSEYVDAIRALSAAGIPTTTHAIGDQGIDFVARAIAQLPHPRPAHRVEHIETVTDEVLELFADQGIHASMQPTHCSLFTRADETDNWSIRLGHERSERGFRCRDFREAGVTMALGTDWPVAPGDARGVIADAQLRRVAGKVDDEPIRPDQRLTAYQALQGLTTHAWASIGREGGTIEIGAPAHLTVFNEDPLTCNPDDFASATALLTVVDGSIVVDRT